MKKYTDEVMREMRGALMVIPMMIVGGIFLTIIYVFSNAGGEELTAALVFAAIPIFFFVTAFIYLPYRVANILKCSATVTYGTKAECTLVELIAGRPFVGNGSKLYRAVVSYMGRQYKTRLLFTRAEKQFLEEKQVVDAKIRGRHIVLMGIPLSDRLDSVKDIADMQYITEQAPLLSKEKDDGLSQLREQLAALHDPYQKMELLSANKDKITSSAFLRLKEELGDEYVAAIKAEAARKSSFYEKYLVFYVRLKKANLFFEGNPEPEKYLWSNKPHDYETQVFYGLMKSLADAGFFEKISLLEYFEYMLSDNYFDRALDYVVSSSRFWLDSSNREVFEKFELLNQMLSNIKYFKSKEELAAAKQELGGFFEDGPFEARLDERMEKHLSSK